MKRLGIVGTNTLLQMAEKLFERGEITEEQFERMKVRNDALSIEREDVIIIER